MIDFPPDEQFLELLDEALKHCEVETKQFSIEAGEKLPATIVKMGTLLSLVYRASCCFWGCHGGDHQIERLAGRITNQSVAAIKLIQFACYDEALMLIRGIGETSNLLHLFHSDESKLEQWKRCTRKERLRNFSPVAVRIALESYILAPITIDQARYERLCEVGTHPVPGQIPGHFTGTGRPILGGILQPAGIYVCYTELGFALSAASLALISQLGLNDENQQAIFNASVELVESLGAITIMNYEDLLQEASEKARKSGGV